MQEKFFSDEELREMGRRTVDRLTEAIDAGETEAAKKLAQRMYNEFLAMHDLYRNWVTATLSAVGREYGDEALERIMCEGVDAWWTPVVASLPQGPDAMPARIKMLVAGLRGHLQPLEITEDAEKVEIKLCPCGSGGRLVQEGKYGGPEGFLNISEPQALTYGRANFPVYCAHEYAMEKVDIEANGRPFAVVEPADRIGEGFCKMIVYKDPDKIPDKYYERLGLKKNESV